MKALADCFAKVRASTLPEYALPESVEDRITRMAKSKLGKKKKTAQAQIKAAKDVVDDFIVSTQSDIDRIEKIVAEREMEVAKREKKRVEQVKTSPEPVDLTTERKAAEPIGPQPLPDKPYIKKAVARAGKKKVREAWERLQENLRALEGESMRFDEATAEEKAGPTQATQDERTYAHSGEAVEFGRKSLTLDEIRSRTRQILNDAGWLNGGGLNPRLGQEVMKFLRGTSPLLVITNNPVIRFWMGKSILQDPSLRGQLRLDEREMGRVEKDLSTMLTQASRTMLGARGDFYNPVQEIGEEGRRDVDAESKKRGIDDIPEFTESILKEVEDKQKERVKSLTPEDKAVILDQAAAEAEDAGWMENALGAFTADRRKLLEKIISNLKRLGELRSSLASRVAKSAPQPVGGEAPMSVAEIEAEISRLVEETNELVDAYLGRKKSKAKPKAERVEKEAKQIVDKAESEEGVAQATFTDWVNGQSQEGIDNFEDIVLENVNANGFNREAFSESLANKFEKVDPLFIEAVTNKIAEALDGKTEEQTDSTPDYDGRAKKIVAKAVAQDAMPEPTEKQIDPLTALIKKRLKGEVNETQFIAEATRIGIEEESAFALNRKVERDIQSKEGAKLKKMADDAVKIRNEAIESAVKKASKGKVPDLSKTNKFIKALEYALENGVMNADSVRDAFAESYDLHGLTTERLERLGRAIKKINDLPDGQLKQTFLEDARKILNDIAPSSTVMSVAYQNLMSGVLSGVSTMTAQFSGLSRILNPMQAAWSFLVQAGVNPLTSPKMLTKVWWDYARESMNAASMVAAGLEGSMGGRMKGLGVSPSRIQDFRPTGMDLGLLPWKDLGDARIGKSSIIRWMLGGTPSSEALRTLKKIALTPSWMARRSLNFIRSAEAWSGSVDKNMTFKAIAMSKLIKDGMNPNKAWNTVQDWTGPTNKEMWDEAKAQADKELADGNISKHAVRQRVEELVQDKLDAEHKLEIKNRHREMSAHLNFKSEPLTKMGTWFSEKVMRNAPLPVKSIFLFSRFFANAIETAIFNSPLGFIHMSKERAAKGAQDEREKRIEAVFGSLEEYRQYRNGLASSSVVSSFAMSMAMALSWALWKWMDEDDEDKSPPFWITGSTPPSSPYATGRQLEAQGWWKPSTLFLRIPGTDSTLAINYVQANPQLAITLNAIGNTADRVMFPEMLTYKTDPRTGERTRSMFKTVIQPWMNALASPATRSTYVTTLQAFERAFDGNPQSLMKLLSRPVGDTLAASTIGGPISRDLAKMAKPEVPRASQSAAQAFASGIPFAHAMGADTGLPMLNQFGEEISPFAYFPFFSAKQESSEPVKKAAKVLNDTGITKAGMEEWMMDSDLVELAANGERYLLSLDERREVLGEIGQRFADLINSNSDRIRRAKDDSHDKAKKIVQELQTRARKSVLNGWRDRIKKEQP